MSYFFVTLTYKGLCLELSDIEIKCLTTFFLSSLTAMVEVIHQWPSLKYPEMAILKIVGVTAVLFLAGLLPWVDNYAHIAGFVTGFFLSYALMPFISFSNSVQSRSRRTVLFAVCLAALFFIFTCLVFVLSRHTILWRKYEIELGKSNIFNPII